jgi:hypothetical protein
VSAEEAPRGTMQAVRVGLHFPHVDERRKGVRIRLL